MSGGFLTTQMILISSDDDSI